MSAHWSKTTQPFWHDGVGIANIPLTNVPTPTGSRHIAQGCPQSGKPWAMWPVTRFNPNGVASGMGRNPVGVEDIELLTPRVFRCAADPGLWDVTPLGSRTNRHFENASGRVRTSCYVPRRKTKHDSLSTTVQLTHSIRSWHWQHSGGSKHDCMQSQHGSLLDFRHNRQKRFRVLEQCIERMNDTQLHGNLNNESHMDPNPEVASLNLPLIYGGRIVRRSLDSG